MIQNDFKRKHETENNRTQNLDTPKSFKGSGRVQKRRENNSRKSSLSFLLT
jgi:hypothetical protein